MSQWYGATTVGALLVSALPALGEGWAPPATLRETGLYVDWDRKIVAPENLPYTPQYPLWTDGATKRRFIHLPRGAWIDASDPDAWRFPPGTRLWKEFSFGRRVETRYLEKTALGWEYAVYVWNEDETEATLAPERGVPRAALIRDDVWHSVPSRYDCRICHEGRPVPVLGFGALQLSTDRDPRAPHAERPSREDVDLRVLVERGLLRGLPSRLVRRPPRIRARDASERAALGYLFANCAMCHNASGPLASLGLSLDYRIGREREDASADALAAVGAGSRFAVPGEAPGRSLRVRPGDPDTSALFLRMDTRNAMVQMPPLGTHLVDEDAVRLVRRWIARGLRSGGAVTATRKETGR
jgi:hypothetical protein